MMNMKKMKITEKKTVRILPSEREPRVRVISVSFTRAALINDKKLLLVSSVVDP
jgi:hypothetical protein